MIYGYRHFGTGASPPGIGPWWRHQFWLGALCVLAGVVVLLFPEILAYIVAGIIILFGANLMTSAWQLRRARKGATIEVEVHDPNAGNAP